MPNKCRKVLPFRRRASASRESYCGRLGPFAFDRARRARPGWSWHLHAARQKSLWQKTADGRTARGGSGAAARRDHRFQWRRRGECLGPDHPGPGPLRLPDIRPQPDDESWKAEDRAQARASLAACSGRPAGWRAVRALTWLGPEKAEEALSRIKRKLPPAEFGELVAAAPQFPTWLARSVGRAAHG